MSPPALCALLSFYDEKPEHLARLIASLPIGHVTHLAALDGAYSLYPDGKPSSPGEQHNAIRSAAQDAGIALELKVPARAWAANEIEKRTALFALGETMVGPDDWYLVMDADESVKDAPTDLLHRLAVTEFDVGNITYCQSRQRQQFPKLFRAIRGIHCHDNHFTYMTPDGRRLWGHMRQGILESREPVSDMYVTHHLQERAPERQQAKERYYRDRDEQHAELIP